MSKHQFFSYICTAYLSVLILFLFNNYCFKTIFRSLFYEQIHITHPVSAKSVISSNNNIFCIELSNNNMLNKFFRFCIHKMLCKWIFNFNIKPKTLHYSFSFSISSYKMLKILRTYAKRNPVKSKCSRKHIIFLRLFLYN